MEITYSIIVKGKVQGVFYRQSTKEKAIAIGVKGIVRNENDGSVKIIATGSKEQLDKLIEWCRQGPPKATVESVHAKEEAYRNFTGFSIDR
ncbi:MAG TPA: acylphosphatase [Chitinophagaceae bacterium]|jgi:acylphosphatase|nr:acylphosphatase [Chitinophagaceae bacterium]